MGKRLMIKKLSAVFAVLFLAVSTTLVLSQPVEAFDSNAKPTMLNRTAISMGDPSKAENIFYDKDTANDKMVWQNITKGCYSDIALETRGGVQLWVLRSSEKLPDGTCSPEKETRLDTPANWPDRRYVVFYKGSDDTINSVKADVDNTFINTGLGKHDEADAIYIERDDMDPYDCPSLIIDQGNGDGWIYVMMRRAANQGNASEQYSALMRELGSKSFFPGSPDMSAFDEGKGLCEVVPADGDDDKDKILNYYGLPGSYYNTRAGNENRETVDLGFSGSKLGGFDLHKMFGPDAAGMALKGPLAGGFIASGDLEVGGREEDDAPICSAGALGWVLCPLSEAMVGAIEGIANLLESFLVFQPLTTSEQGKAIQAIWGSLLGIANAGLIIAFLVVVFSQATSIGLNNYGIKKLLPRVIAAAILMNLSFYLCAIAVDISNILGVSIKGIADVGLEAVASGINIPELDSEASPGDWFAISAIGLLGTAILVGTGAIFLLIPVLISGLMAVLTAFLILAARQVLITLLIIVAPLAILAWILPNTESWFTKWRKLFTTLLLLYPMVMAIFYGAILVSSVILASAGNSGNAINNWTVQILAFLVLVVPLFSLPFVMKAAGGVMDRLGVLVNNRNKGLIDRSRKMSQNAAARTRSKRAANYDPTRTGFSRRKNLGARLANRPMLGVTRDQRARGRFMVAQSGDQYEGEQTKLAAATLSQRGITGDKHALYDVAANRKNNRFLRRAAALQLGENGAADKLEDLFSGKASETTGVRAGADTETKRMAAYAIGVNAGKLSGPANPLFFEAVTYESNMKQGKTDADALVEGQKVREQKVTSQMGSGYLAGLKADQIISARKTIESIADPGQKTAAVESVTSAIKTISTDPRQLNTMTDEQVIEVGKMAKRLGISTAGVGPAFTSRYTSAANAALAAHASGSKPIPPVETPTVSSSGW